MKYKHRILEAQSLGRGVCQGRWSSEGYTIGVSEPRRGRHFRQKEWHVQKHMPKQSSMAGRQKRGEVRLGDGRDGIPKERKWLMEQYELQHGRKGRPRTLVSKGRSQPALPISTITSC